MKRLLAVLFLVASMSQAAVTLTLTGGAGGIDNGDYGTLILTMSGGAAPLGLQFTLNTPSGMTDVVPIAGPIVSAATKLFRCSPYANNSVKCSVVGNNTNTIADGVIATYTIKTGAAMTYPLVFTVPNVAAESMTGSTESISHVTSSHSLPSDYLCDVNHDGVIDTEDLRLITNWMTGAELVPTNVVPSTTCDINSDGVCNILDVLIVQRKLASGGACP
jgi:Dockerin type I domain